MEEDFDIYTDLPNIDLAKSNINDEPKTDYTCNCEELKEKFSSLTNKFESISKANKNLEKNLASLLKTAKAEIARKDKMIEELRNQLDNTVFRRNNNRSLHSSNLRSSYPCNTMAEKYENVTSLIHSEEDIFISEQIEPHHTEYKSKKSQKIDQVPVTIFGERLQKRIMDDAKEERRLKALSNLSSEANVNKIPEESIVESDKENGSQSIINNNINESNVIVQSSNSGTLYKKNSGKRSNEEEDTRKRKHFKADDNEDRHDDIEYNSIAPYDTKDDLMKLQDQPCIAHSFKQEQVPLETKYRDFSEYGDTKRAQNCRNVWKREERISSTRSYDNTRSNKGSTDSSRNHRIASKASERFNSDHQHDNYVDDYRKNDYRYGSSSSRSYFKSDHESSNSHRLREKSGRMYRDRKYDDYKYDNRYRNDKLGRGYDSKEIGGVKTRYGRIEHGDLRDRLRHTTSDVENRESRSGSYKNNKYDNRKLKESAVNVSEDKNLRKVDKAVIEIDFSDRMVVNATMDQSVKKNAEQNSAEYELRGFASSGENTSTYATAKDKSNLEEGEILDSPEKKDVFAKIFTNNQVMEENVAGDVLVPDARENVFVVNQTVHVKSRDLQEILQDNTVTTVTTKSLEEVDENSTKQADVALSLLQRNAKDKVCTKMTRLNPADEPIINYQSTTTDYLYDYM